MSNKKTLNIDSNVNKFFIFSNELNNVLSEMTSHDVEFVIYEIHSLKNSLCSVLSSCSLYDESYDSINLE
jgi:hypothetical protein